MHSQAENAASNITAKIFLGLWKKHRHTCIPEHPGNNGIPMSYSGAWNELSIRHATGSSTHQTEQHEKCQTVATRYWHAPPALDIQPCGVYQKDRHRMLVAIRPWDIPRFYQSRGRIPALLPERGNPDLF